MINEVMRWVEQRSVDCEPPVLEVGSYNENGSVRPLFGKPYIGIDMRDGPGVDAVVNITQQCQPFPDNYFGTIVSTETLEHVDEPWVAVEKMARMLKPGGKLLVTVPFMFGVHNYPDDYWRMTASGLRYLFERSGLEPIETVTEGTHTYGSARKP